MPIGSLPVSTEDGVNDEYFAAKVNNFTWGNPSTAFTGPLAFLNSYDYIMSEGLLTGLLGASAGFQAGGTFWNRCGRTLFNASLGHLAYNVTFQNGTSRPKPVLRTAGQSRIENIANATSDFDVVIISEGGTENDTLASYDSCFNDNVSAIGYIGDDGIYTYIPVYLQNVTASLQVHTPSGILLTTNDTYAMQSICAYEPGYVGFSDFCNLFAEDEWAGFENTLDMEYFYDYGYGNPTGRAQGIGYVQELFARLQSQYITSSNPSVNSTLDNNAQQFALSQAFYADFTHDDIIVSVLTALSVDYLREAPSLTQFPPDPNRHFILSKMTPFGGRLVTEVIGCNVPDPSPVHDRRTQCYLTQYGYDPTKAANKFPRMRLDNGIVPTIRGGMCEGRIDGMCEMGKSLESQANADTLANYDLACFGNYIIDNVGSRGQDYDGTISAWKFSS